jgi:hypothetical protein
VRSPRPLVAAAAALVLACHGQQSSGDRAPESRSPDENPAWVTALIRKLSGEPVANPPAAILRYEYKGRTVYYLTPRCCDVPGDLYDAGGQLICHPDGGITGAGDGRCTDFVAERKNEHLVWRDPRKSS